MRLNRKQIRRLLESETKNLLFEGQEAPGEMIRSLKETAGGSVLRNIVLNTRLYPEMFDSGRAGISLYSAERGHILAEFDYGALSRRDIENLRAQYFISCFDEGGMYGEGEGNVLTMFICSEAPGKITYTG